MPHDLKKEAIIFLIDDGESSINCDYGAPGQTRLQAQVDAVKSISRLVFAGHGESAIGIMTIGGRVTNHKGLSRPTDREDLTRTIDGILGQLRMRTNCTGPAKLLAGLETARCALVTRENATQSPHIIAFVCSSVTESADELVKRIQNLQKHSITVDIVSMNREQEDVDAKLKNIASRTRTKYVAIPAREVDVSLSSKDAIANLITQAGVIEGVNVSESSDNFFAGDFDDANDPALQAAIAESRRIEEARQLAAAAAASSQQEQQQEQSSTEDKSRGDRMDES